MRWQGDAVKYAPIKGLDWGIIIARAFLAVVLVVVFLPFLILCRVVGARGFQGRLAQIGSRLMLFVIGLRLAVRGTDARRAGGIIANHSSWLDIFVVYASAPGQFVAKAEVAKWPGIGAMGQMVGTLFIRRNRREAKEHLALLEDALQRGERLIFFPEGTSSDGQRILPFRTTLFDAFADRDLVIQPCFIQYQPPKGVDPRVYGFYGGMSFAPHLLHVLAMRRRGSVNVALGEPIKTSDFEGRKVLAAQLERDLRALAPDQIANRPAND